MPKLESSHMDHKLDRLQELAALFPNMDIDCLLTSFLLIRTSHDLYNQSASLLTENGLSQGKVRILASLLLRKELVLPSELAKSAGVTRSTMTGLINGLEKDGLIRRGAHEDRRMTAIHLTEQGEALLMNVMPAYGDLVSGMLSHLTSEERIVLKGLLHKIRTGIEQTKPE
ncbi:MarR family winged helix-turn-helix transcriptional regulator [Paenibacillus kandeliae]|uniref:MarR family winged helix-turn-helix transcriptional regulator n=1 Tax=Paenibacillus kandeliae TaxID=3231269 RepID=UPI00345B0042